MDIVLVIDSGIGGLSLLSKLYHNFPSEHFVYLADDAFLPYGSHDEKELKNHICIEINKLFKIYNIKMIVIACNTLSAVAVSYLRNLYSLPIIAIEPAIKPASLLLNDNIFVFVTPLTACQKKFKLLVNLYGNNVSVFALSNLATICEKFVLGELSKTSLLNYLINLKNSIGSCKLIVLGCTHYSFIKHYLQVVFHCQCIDGEYGVINQVGKFIIKNSHKIGNINILFSSGDYSKAIAYMNIVNQLLKL